MRATYTATIKQVNKEGSNVELALTAQGKVEDTKVIGDSKISSMDIVLRLKPIIADQLRLGSKITITLSDEEVVTE